MLAGLGVLGILFGVVVVIIASVDWQWEWLFMGKVAIAAGVALALMGAGSGGMPEDETDEDNHFEFKRLNTKYDADVEELERLGNGNLDELINSLPKHLRKLVDDERKHEEDETARLDEERESALIKQIEEALLANATHLKAEKAGDAEEGQAKPVPEASRLKVCEAVRRRAPRVFTLDYDGDLRATATHTLRDMVSLLNQVAQPGVDEVVVRLNSGGGLVSEYGLAASQLQRLRDAKINLTVCIDVVGASGGYLMAAVADHIVAAPFAAVGSIGVVATIPNVHGLLQKNQVDVMEFTAGKYKRTITPYGEATDEKKAKIQEEIAEIHDLMKEAIGRARPSLDIDAIATGEVWLGEIAKQKGLVDQVSTSDEYLACKIRDHHDVIQIEQKKENKGFAVMIKQRISRATSSVCAVVGASLSAARVGGGGGGGGGLGSYLM